MPKRAAAVAATLAPVKGATSETAGAAAVNAAGNAVEGAPNGATAPAVNGDSAGHGRPGNMSLAQLASSMSKGGRRGAPAASSNGTSEAEQANTEAAAEGEGEEQTPEADAAANDEGTEQTPAEGAGAESEAGAPEGAELPEGETTEEEEALPKGVKDLQKRVDKLTARLRQAEAREAALLARQPEDQRSEVRGQAEGAGAGAVHPELVALDGDLALYRQALEFADLNPDGGEYVDPQGRKSYYDAAAVRTIRRNAEEGRQAALSERAVLKRSIQGQTLAAQQADQAEAVKAYPWLAKPADKLTAAEAEMVGEFQDILRMEPGLKRRPDYASWVADAVAGRRARIAGGKVAAKAGATNGLGKPAGGSRNPPPVVTRTVAAAPKVNPGMAAVKEAEAKFRKSGNVKDYTNLLKAQGAAKRQAGRGTG